MKTSSPFSRLALFGALFLFSEGLTACGESSAPERGSELLAEKRTPRPSRVLRGWCSPLRQLSPRVSQSKHWGVGSHSGNRGYFAIDLASQGRALPIGTPVYPMRAGRVHSFRDSYPDLHPRQRAGKGNAKRYNFITIKHESGLYSSYVHLKQNSVRVRQGQWVTVDHIIAKSGHNGWSSAPHLHVEVSEKVGRELGMTQPFSIDFSGQACRKPIAWKGAALSASKKANTFSNDRAKLQRQKAQIFSELRKQGPRCAISQMGRLAVLSRNSAKTRISISQNGKAVIYVDLRFFLQDNPREKAAGLFRAYSHYLSRCR